MERLSVMVLSAVLLVSSCNRGYEREFSSYSERQRNVPVTKPNLKQPERQKQVVAPKRVSRTYSLEFLCDTEVKSRDMELNVYISPSKILWDYDEYRGELFGHVAEFFQRQEVNCKFNYRKVPVKNPKIDNDSFSVEIYDSGKTLRKRYFELMPPENEEEKKKKEHALLLLRGYAVPERGVALINGGWEEFRGHVSKKDVVSQFPEPYKGVTRKEYLFRGNASNICHEVLHCAGLFHPTTFKPLLVDYSQNGVPNIMSFFPPRFSKKNSTGYIMTIEQKKLFHSFLAGENTFRAFLYSDRDLDVYTKRVAEDNDWEEGH